MSNSKENETNASSPGDPVLDAIIATYLAALDRGENPDQDELILKHPAYASQLAGFFANQAHYEGSNGCFLTSKQACSEMNFQHTSEP